MGILEQVFEYWMQHNMNKHDRILHQEDRKLIAAQSRMNGLDQTADDFEQKMEITAIEMERWIKEKTRANE